MLSEIFPDWMDHKDYARALKKHPTTIRRWAMKEGLPAAKLNNMLLINVPKARVWLEQKMIKT